jgi:hypothetical protein
VKGVATTSVCVDSTLRDAFRFDEMGLALNELVDD